MVLNVELITYLERTNQSHYNMCRIDAHFHVLSLPCKTCDDIPYKVTLQASYSLLLGRMK